MKKLFAVFILAASLIGCTQVNDLLNVKNPVSNNALGAAISTYGIADTAIIAYRGLPRCTVTNNFSATNICYKRSVLVQAQVYDAAANKAINSAVAFQRANPTLDASSYVTAAVAAVDTFKSFALASGIPGVQ